MRIWMTTHMMKIMMVDKLKDILDKKHTITMLMTIDPMTMLMTTHTVTKPMTIASSDSEGASRVLQTCWVVAESPLHAFSPQPSSGGGGGGG